MGGVVFVPRRDLCVNPSPNRVPIKRIKSEVLNHGEMGASGGSACVWLWLMTWRTRHSSLVSTHLERKRACLICSFLWDRAPGCEPSIPYQTLA